MESTEDEDEEEDDDELEDVELERRKDGCFSWCRDRLWWVSLNDRPSLFEGFNCGGAS